MDKNAVILLSGVSLLRREAGGMLQVQAVPARVDKVISAMKPPAFRLHAVAWEVLGRYFYPDNFFFFFLPAVYVFQRKAERGILTPTGHSKSKEEGSQHTKGIVWCWEIISRPLLHFN